MFQYRPVCRIAVLFLVLVAGSGVASADVSRADAIAAMRRATRFMVEEVSVNGGYVWSYLPDLSRRWGELEATPHMIWVQSPGTVQMGHVFLDAYHATADEYFYDAARSAAEALIRGQLPGGGWHYVIDFEGEAHLREWYATIAKNAWRLEEYQHYYGNATFDDSTTAHATLFLLRVYLEKRDASVKAALDRAIQFTLDAQYPSGGWPQRHPPSEEPGTGGADYTRHITYNDGVCAGNIVVLLRCHQALRDPRLVPAIRRGMDGFLATLHASPKPGWSLQHDATTLKPAGARSYEPPSLATHTTAANVRQLLQFYQLTGDSKYLAPIPSVLAWLRSVRLPPGIPEARGASHPTFVDLETGQPLYVHRTGSNVANGRYVVDRDPARTIAHYSSFRHIDIDELAADYDRIRLLSPEVVTRDSPLLQPARLPAFPRFVVASVAGHRRRDSRRPEAAAAIVAALDPGGRWISDLRTTSNPYRKNGSTGTSAGDFSQAFVGDETDTSPYAAKQAVPGISTSTFIRNLSALIAHVAEAPPETATPRPAAYEAEGVSSVRSAPEK